MEEVNETENVPAETTEPAHETAAELAAARQENEMLRQLIRLQKAKDELTEAFRSAGARSPALLFAEAADELKFDGEGNLVNRDAIVVQLKRAFPEQFESVQLPSINGGAGAGARRTLTKEALEQMKPADIARLDWEEVKSVLSEG